MKIGSILKLVVSFLFNMVRDHQKTRNKARAKEGHMGSMILSMK